ncbi:ribonuclease H-like domain-containing protein [Gorillibacterium massiliense]|uniref:ribonuclease H-like domain-containing protein n=1 Tax=Gorillibacterium massiliense TaxID=1280390 RepID=UPI0004B31B3D|nr:ribonuclease H-like domain-containing protein [Gorillibacterium massiliense]
MSNLKERLNRLTKSTGGEKKPSLPDNLHEEMFLEDAEDQDDAITKCQSSLSLGGGWEAIGACLATNDWGSFVKRTCRYPLDYAHGRHLLGDIQQIASGLTAFYPEADVTPGSLLFFDTETTGLGVGAGNVAFMLGIGYYEEAEFIVEQLFIRNPAEELAMLAYFHELASRFSHFVSYNGRTFDWPVLQNRFIMNRLDFTWDNPLHLDFLYPSRSLWRHTMPSCRLGKVEEEQLRVNRDHDVPGSLAPALYFQYLAEGDPQVMKGVFLHNEMDILSLAGLAIHFGKALLGEWNPFVLEAEELFRLGLWLDKMGKEELAEAMFVLLLRREEEECAPYWAPLAAYYKKKKNEPLAISLWHRSAERLTGEDGGRSFGSPEPFIELAMHYEHKEKDYAAALGFAEEALRFMQRRASLTRSTAKHRAEQEEVKKRIRRLKMKLDTRSLRLAYESECTESITDSALSKAAPKRKPGGKRSGVHAEIRFAGSLFSAE